MFDYSSTLRSILMECYKTICSYFYAWCLLIETNCVDQLMFVELIGDLLPKPIKKCFMSHERDYEAS